MVLAASVVRDSLTARTTAQHRSPVILIDPTTVIYSASDLTAAAKCEWALMRKLDAKLGRVERVDDIEDDMLVRAGLLGTAHELRVLESLKRTRQVVEFQQPAFGEYAEAAALTAQALRDKADVLFQATFFDGRLLGFADFIMLNDDGVYEVYDTKLARSAKITALLQLAAYSDQVMALGVEVGENVYLILGDGRTSTHALRDILPVYRKRRERLQAMLDDRIADDAPTPWGDPRYSVCGRCAACTQQVELHRDVLLVAGMRLTQRRKLNAAGITTIDQLAIVPDQLDGRPAVEGLSAATLAGLRSQARIQTAPHDPDVPAYDVYNPQALAALPLPDPGDIFFDFEGDPLYSESARGKSARGKSARDESASGTSSGNASASGASPVEWGLDYLFGLVEPDDTFRTFWAHDYAEERVALEQFLAYVAERRAQHPGMHIYHYAAYERTHLLSLAARHGVGEDAVDDLLRDDVLVDLYPLVKKSVRVGSHSYSIKKLEPLYMSSERSGVANAADSVTEYADARQLIRDGDVAAGQAKLDAIASYNEYDCVSTLRLRDWLLARAAENGISPTPARDLELDLPIVREPSPVYLALSQHVADVLPGERTADDTAIALASAAIDYHRREGKKFWQDHFDRLISPIDEWADTRNVLVVEHAEVVKPWFREGRQKKDRRIIEVSGTLSPGSSFKIEQNPYLVYEDPQPPIAARRSPGARASSEGEIVDIIEEAGHVTYVIQELLETGADQFDELPAALTPPAPPRATPQPEAIEEWGARVLGALPGMLPNAALDVLRRIPPRGTLAPAGDDTVTAIRDSLLTLDHSYLAVQGPPGTGKTYTGSRVIADLVKNHGWRVGIVAQSHETVKNMLKAIADAGLDPKRIAKKPKKGDTDVHPWVTLSTPANTADFTGQDDGWVIGGTAWTFANAGTIPRESLDLLVIDEAGQFSLASTIASAVAAQRLLLLGDPQQLPQVSQGSHPEPVDVSALGWLSDGHDVLPPEFGYFLAKSWRMHPAVCAPVSRLSYEGKLESKAEDRMLVGLEPGLHPMAVDHHLNSTSSPQEADRVVELVRDALGRAWTVKGATRPLEQEDIIVVAPYNAQVELIGERLTEAGLGAVPVGTVDKFQGREAAIAIVSLAASSADEVPRGLEFLLLANRLNVAISRAQWAAYLLYSPALVEYLPTNPVALAQLSAFIGLVEAP
jgi:predicted RecB family nuclease